MSLPPGATLVSGTLPPPSLPAGATLETGTPITDPSAMRAPADTGFTGKIAQWAQNVSNDIKNGTDVTGVGTVLKKMGAHGVYSGEPQAVGDFMGSLPLGLARMVKGGAEIATPGQNFQGAKDVIGGGLDAATIPASFASPEIAEASASAIDKAIPQTARAGRAFKDVSAAAGQHTVAITDEVSNALQRISQLAKSGGQMPKVAGDFIDRTSNLDLPPINYDEARDFYSTLSSKFSPDQAMKLDGRMRFALNQFRDALGKTISSTASSAGKLDQYRGAMSEYRNASRLGDAGEATLDFAKKYAKELISGTAVGAGAAGAYKIYEATK